MAGLAATHGRIGTHLPSFLDAEEPGSELNLTERQMAEHINLPDFLITLEEYSKI